jgi:hypothetical protein
VLDDIDRKAELFGMDVNDRELYLDTKNLLNVLIKEDNTK